MHKNRPNSIYGIRAIIETIEAGEELEKVLIQKNLKGNLIQLLRKKVVERNIPVSFVPVEKLNRVTKKNHQGAIAFISPVRYFPLDQVVNQSYESGRTPIFIALDGVTDVRNFGSIARTAECMGSNAILIPTTGSAQINSDAIKTSAGALQHIPVARENDLVKALKYLQDSGFNIIGCTEKATDHIYDLNLKDPICLVFGSEEDGISEDVLEVCINKGKIPITGKIESLNVGVAVAMLLSETARQRALE